jgi:hypothetical protein
MRDGRNPPQLRLPGRALWRRELPAEGTVTVVPGTLVEPDTVIAEGSTTVPPVVIELGQARPLVLSGQVVKAGEAVARRKKVLGRGDDVQTPVDGTVVRIMDAELLLSPPARVVQLTAQLPGTVAAVHAGWGVDIEGNFGLLRGFFATYVAELTGILGDSVAIVAEPLLATRLESLAGQGVRAVIGPSWAGAAQSSPVPLFLTEPAAGTPMATPLAEALQRHLGARVALQAWPEPLLAFASAEVSQPQCFGPDAWVRTADGRAGRLVSVGESLRFFASGVRALGAEVDLGDQTAQLPLDSLEWIA